MSSLSISDVAGQNTDIYARSQQATAQSFPVRKEKEVPQIIPAAEIIPSVGTQAGSSSSGGGNTVGSSGAINWLA